MKNIAQALVSAQKDFAPALKTNANPFFKSKYADLSVCIEAVIDALHKNGIALIQRNHDCENGVKVETILLHESGEEYSGGVLHVPALKNDPQAYGSALTYARRYSLMATCGIAPEDDDGNAAQVKPAPAIKLPALTDAEAEREYHKWMETKSLCVDEDGDPSIEMTNTAWYKLDSNIRTAITKYGKSLALTQEIDANAKEHIKSI